MTVDQKSSVFACHMESLLAVSLLFTLMQVVLPRIDQFLSSLAYLLHCAGNIVYVI